MSSPDEFMLALEKRMDSMSVTLARLETRLAQVLALLLDAPESQANSPDSGFKCRDQVQLTDRVLRINGRSVGLSKRQAVLFAILMRHALRGNPGFLPTADIIREIERDFSSLWSMPLPEDVHETVYRIRNKLALDRDLLESAASKGGGFRVSTSRKNIVPLDTPWTEDA